MKKKISPHVTLEITESKSVVIETRVDYKAQGVMHSDIDRVHLNKEESINIAKTIIKNSKK